MVRFQETLSYFRTLNSAYLMLFGVLSLTFLGLVMLSSVEQSFSGQFSKQLIWFIIALGCGVCAALLDLEKLRPFIGWGVAAVIALLLLVLIPGVGLKINGARRWLDLGWMHLQVSDCVRPVMVLGLAHYLADL